MNRTNLSRSILTVLPLCFFLNAGSCQGGTSTKTTSEVTSTQSATPTPNSLPTLSSDIPKEITFNGPNNPNLEQLQHAFDVFSWDSFVALNWPTNPDGTPNTSVTIGQGVQVPTVWETWKESRDIFLPTGSKPSAWGTTNPVPDACKTIDPKTIPPGTLHLTQVGKTPNVLDESKEPFTTGPLIDQNGNYTRFEILTNQTMFEFILNNQLYSKVGQAAFGKAANFPASDTKQNLVGSIMIKAAWVKMKGKFDPRRFHTVTALVYDNPNEQAGVKASCSLEQVGLVGLHIGHKTENEPQWVWSTFEHIDNAPTKGQAVQQASYNFHNPECKNCTPNSPPPRPWNPANLNTPPTQVERVIPITQDVMALNEQYHTALKKAVPDSIWANYQLISTQWPTNAQSKTDPTGVPAPVFLANTTMETYIQGSDALQASSSCIQCHNNATMTNGKVADFTYLLQRAQ